MYNMLRFSRIILLIILLQIKLPEIYYLMHIGAEIALSGSVCVVYSAVGCARCDVECNNMMESLRQIMFGKKYSKQGGTHRARKGHAKSDRKLAKPNSIVPTPFAALARQLYIFSAFPLAVPA